MLSIVELRNGGTRHAAVVAAATTFLLGTGGAWVTWKVLQGDASTLLRSEFTTWLSLLAAVAVSVALVGAVFWRGRNVRLGLAVGFALAAVGIVGGLLTDILTSAS